MTKFGNKRSASHPLSPVDESLNAPSKVALSLEAIFARTADPREIVRLDELGELSPKLRVAAILHRLVEVAAPDPSTPEIAPAASPTKKDKIFGCKVPPGHDPVRPLQVSPAMFDEIIKSGRQ